MAMCLYIKKLHRATMNIGRKTLVTHLHLSQNLNLVNNSLEKFYYDLAAGYLFGMRTDYKAIFGESLPRK